MIGRARPEKLEKIIEEPKITKNTRRKKSRKDLTLAEIWKFSEELAKAKPARNPPISIENPVFAVIVATPKHQAKLVKNRSS